MLDNILLALSSLRSNKMRSLLTMLGIIIGIGAVIAIETVGNSLTGSINSSMSSFGATNITVSLAQKDSEQNTDTSGDVRLRMFMSEKPEASDLITEEMIAEYRKTFADKIAYIPLTQSAGSGTAPQADDPSSTVTTTVTGINDEYMAANEVKILYGRGVENEKDTGRNVCVVSDWFVENAMNCAPLDAVGKRITLTIDNMPYTFYIEGVYKYESDTASTRSNNSVVTDLYIPMDAARTISGVKAGYQSLTVMATPGTDTSAFLTVTGNFFASYYTRNDTWTAEATSLESLLETLTSMLNTVSLAISAIAAISLLVGGIGVMNIMLVSISERTREIGTRKALGAPGRTIRMQFIVEAMVICLIGGILGVVLGVGLGTTAANLMGYAAKPSVGAIALAVGFSMTIGIFFGYYPASKAAKMDPIEALRYE